MPVSKRVLLICIALMQSLIMYVYMEEEVTDLQRRVAFIQELKGKILRICPFRSPISRRKYRKKICWRKNRGRDWWEEVVKKYFTDEDFTGNFRVSKPTFKFICNRLRPYLMEEENYVVTPLKIEKKVAIALYKLASCCEYRVVANQFNTHKTIVHKCLYAFCNAVITELQSEYLILPKGEEAEEIARKFEITCGIPNIIGAIDGTHVPILPPALGQRDFLNRKGWASYNVLAVVDHMYRFRYATCQHPGSTHDAKVLKDSNLYKFAEQMLPQQKRVVQNVNLGFFILGDPAYPLLKWLMKPFKGNISREEESFNVYLSRGRVVVENAFGRLKARFRILLKRIDIDYKFVPKVVITCMILHNIVEMNKDTFLESWMNDVKQAELIYPQPRRIVNREFDNLEGGQIRNLLKNYMLRFPLRQSRLL